MPLFSIGNKKQIMNRVFKSHPQIRGEKSSGQSIDCVDQVITIFNSLFLNSYNTRLSGGGDEPIYRPASTVGQCHEIIFTNDYFASALHEVAHWCVAGEQRRMKTDYGYWYAPDGRSDSQQKMFEKVEVRPQALEWMFSTAANFRFRLSSDNLDAKAEASQAFKLDVYEQVIDYCEQGFPQRAQIFAAKLKQQFGGADFENKTNYQIEML